MKLATHIRPVIWPLVVFSMIVVEVAAQTQVTGLKLPIAVAMQASTAHAFIVEQGSGRLLRWTGDTRNTGPGAPMPPEQVVPLVVYAHEPQGAKHQSFAGACLTGDDRQPRTWGEGRVSDEAEVPCADFIQHRRGQTVSRATARIRPGRRCIGRSPLRCQRRRRPCARLRHGWHYS